MDNATLNEYYKAFACYGELARKPLKEFVSLRFSAQCKNDREGVSGMLGYLYNPGGKFLIHENKSMFFTMMKYMERPLLLDATIQLVMRKKILQQKIEQQRISDYLHNYNMNNEVHYSEHGYMYNSCKNELYIDMFDEGKNIAKISLE